MRLASRPRRSSLSPTWLLPTSQTYSLELKKELHVNSQTLILASSVPAEIEVTPHYHLSEALFTGSVDLSAYVPSSPLLFSLTLDCNSNITIPSFSKKKNIYGQAKYHGSYYPETNSTTLTSTLHNPDGWEFNDQVKVTSGNILVSGSFSDLSGWSFPPLTYAAGAEILLYNNPSVSMLSTTGESVRGAKRQSTANTTAFDSMQHHSNFTVAFSSQLSSQ